MGTQVSLTIPDQFVEQCKDEGLEPGEVLQSFIADLCFIDSTDGYKGYATTSSGARDAADQYFEQLVKASSRPCSTKQ